jgi:hypothetical protein
MASAESKRTTSQCRPQSKHALRQSHCARPVPLCGGGRGLASAGSGTSPTLLPSSSPFLPASSSLLPSAPCPVRAPSAPGDGQRFLSGTGACWLAGRRLRLPLARCHTTQPTHTSSSSSTHNSHSEQTHTRTGNTHVHPTHPCAARASLSLRRGGGKRTAGRTDFRWCVRSACAGHSIKHAHCSTASSSLVQVPSSPLACPLASMRRSPLSLLALSAVAAVALLALGSAPTAVQAEDLQWGFTGHYMSDTHTQAHAVLDWST